jgi:hypothetical protein
MSVLPIVRLPGILGKATLIRSTRTDEAKVQVRQVPTNSAPASVAGNLNPAA